MKSEPFWWEDAGRPDGPLTQPLPPEVDVLIVGAGLTGLSAARTLARAGKAVLALDAMMPGEGASSRNGGMIGGGHRLAFDTMRARFGHDIALGLLREAHLDSGAFVKALMADENIACNYRETGRFRGLWRDAEYDRAARDLERLQQLIPLEAEMLPRARQHEEVATELYRGGTLFPRHGGLNPARWVAGLLRAALDHGALVQGQTPVTNIEREGAAFRVTTPRGTLRAGAVLAATNGYTPWQLKSLKRRIVPIPSFIVASEPLGQARITELFPRGRMIVESRDRHCYYRPSPDGERIVFGARAALFDAPETLVRRQMRGLLRQVFPQLPAIDISHSWRGFTGFSFDFLPNVGRIDGIWHAMGYSGSGNAMAPWLGHKAALQILGDAAGDTAFSHTGFPLRWWHRGRPWFLPFADLSFRLRDAWNSTVRLAG